MNKEKMTQEQRKQLIEKLRTEYKDLNGKIARLNAFLCDIDFIKKVPDVIEQELMKGQLRAMENYLSNLRGRIMFQEARQKAEKSLDEWKNTMGKIISVQRGPVRLVNTEEQHHCGQDAGHPCGCSAPAYGPNESQPVDLDDACCQAKNNASCPVGDGSGVVNEVPDSIKSLEGMQVIKVCGPKCKDCPCGDGLREYPSGRDASSCVKVELAGGYMLCLAPLPNSIMMDKPCS